VISIIALSLVQGGWERPIDAPSKLHLKYSDSQSDMQGCFITQQQLMAECVEVIKPSDVRRGPPEGAPLQRASRCTPPGSLRCSWRSR